MKQFLRYQISGTVFIIWCVVFFFGKDSDNLHELIQSVTPYLGNMKIIVGLAVAMPIGVLIHQFSVLIKNWIVSQKWDEFSDLPKKRGNFKT